jgi:hypothetical protein
MKQNKQFDNILNECLDRVLRGETIEECLKNYPEQAPELAPLLHTAVTAKQAANIQPRAEFKAQARYAFKSALYEMQDKKTRRLSFLWPSFVWRTGWMVAIIIIMVVVLGGGSTMVAASNSMPDSPLYTVKLATEQAQLAVTPSDIGKAELNARFADRRADEIAYLANKGDAHELQIAAQRMNSNLENMTNLTKSSNKDNKGANNITFNSDSAASTNNANKAAGNMPKPLLAPPPATLPAAAPAGVPPVSTNVPAAGMSVTPKTPQVASAPSISAIPGAPAVKAGPSEVATGGGGPQSVSKNVTPSAAANLPARNAADNTSHGSADNSQNNARTSQNGKAKTTDQAKLKQIIVDNYNNRQERLNETLKKASPDVRPAVRQAMAKSQDEFEKALKNLDESNDDDK